MLFSALGSGGGIADRGGRLRHPRAWRPRPALPEAARARRTVCPSPARRRRRAVAGLPGGVPVGRLGGVFARVSSRRTLRQTGRRSHAWSRRGARRRWRLRRTPRASVFDAVEHMADDIGARGRARGGGGRHRAVRRGGQTGRCAPAQWLADALKRGAARVPRGSTRVRRRRGRNRARVGVRPSAAREPRVHDHGVRACACAVARGTPPPRGNAPRRRSGDVRGIKTAFGCRWSRGANLVRRGVTRVPTREALHQMRLRRRSCAQRWRASRRARAYAAREARTRRGRCALRNPLWAGAGARRVRSAAAAAAWRLPPRRSPRARAGAGDAPPGSARRVGRSSRGSRAAVPGHAGRSGTFRAATTCWWRLSRTRSGTPDSPPSRGGVRSSSRHGAHRRARELAHGAVHAPGVQRRSWPC